jgi:hypothetical protein
MSFSEIGPTQVLMMVAVILLLSAGIAVWAFASKRKTQKLQAQFGSAEYNRTVKAGGSRRQAESSLEKRAERVDNSHRQIVPGSSTPGPGFRRSSSTAPESPLRKPISSWAMSCPRVAIR